MTQRIFAWLAGLLLVLVFLVVISPDLFRGYVFSEDPRTSGQQVYDVYCVGCHGVDGMGNGPAAEFLNPPPRNFVNGDYAFFYFGEPGPLPSDASLAVTIKNGIPGSAMPAFPLLADQEVNDVITYIKSFREGGWDDVELTAAGDVPPIEGETGEELFVAAGCNACHQLDAAGSVGGVGPSFNEVGSRLSVDEITQSIVEPNAVIAENCPGGPCPEGVMPQNFGDRLTEDQIQALAEYLAEQQ
jgi:mono/diheme cytochrome c family protein